MNIFQLFTKAITSKISGYGTQPQPAKQPETKLEKQARKHSIGLTHGVGGIVAETIRESAQEKRLKKIKAHELVKSLDGHGDEQ